MRHLAFVLLATFVGVGCGGCATSQPEPPMVATTVPTPTPKPPPDTASVMHLIGMMGGGHACPVSVDTALTATHMLLPDDKEEPTNERGLRFYRFTTDDMNAGLVTGFRLFIDSDVGTVKSSVKLRFYPISTKEPQIGDRLWLAGYDWRNERDAYKTRLWSGTLVRHVAGHLIFKNPGEPGTSGSCIWNEDGEVIGINSGWKVVGNANDKAVGVGVSVWGPWRPPFEE